MRPKEWPFFLRCLSAEGVPAMNSGASVVKEKVVRSASIAPMPKGTPPWMWLCREIVASVAPFLRGIIIALAMLAAVLGRVLVL